MLRKRLLMLAGVILVALAVIGIFIPLLPTTPLLLLAAACFMRSSDRLYHWLITHRIFGSYITNYREHHAVSRVAKLMALFLLWSTIGYSIVRMSQLWARLALGIILVGVTWHLLTLKTLTREMLAANAHKNAQPADGEPDKDQDPPSI